MSDQPTTTFRVVRDLVVRTTEEVTIPGNVLPDNWGDLPPEARWGWIDRHEYEVGATFEDVVVDTGAVYVVEVQGVTA